MPRRNTVRPSQTGVKSEYQTKVRPFLRLRADTTFRQLQYVCTRKGCEFFAMAKIFVIAMSLVMVVFWGSVGVLMYSLLT